MTKDKMKQITHEELGKWPRLIEFLEENGFYDAPASRKHHGADPGGLFNHSYLVATKLQELTDKLGLAWEREESPMIIGLLHDVCKLDDYVLEVGVDGWNIQWNKNSLWPGHGEKSLIMLQGLIPLTEEEKACIRYHMGAFTDQKEWEYYSRAVEKYPNALYTHMADMIASHIEGA